MNNTVFVETYSVCKDYQNSYTLELPLESFITYCIHKYCITDTILLSFVNVQNIKLNPTLTVQVKNDNIQVINTEEVPWQVSSCLYPVVKFEDTIITGLCAVARHICKYRTSPGCTQEHEEGLLGFRKSCLQAPNEVSIWSKFCEVDLVNTVKWILSIEKLQEVPKNMVRFENHLRKPVRVHNVYKVARDLKKETLKSLNESKEPQMNEQTKQMNQENYQNQKQILDHTRIPKPRKWKSNNRKELHINCLTEIKDLNIDHQFAEGPFLTLADLVLLPLYHILIQSIGDTSFKSLLPLTYNWFVNIIRISDLNSLISVLNNLKIKILVIENIVMPTVEDISLYKCDPKRHNPKKRLFTKEDDIENALRNLIHGMELDITNNDFDTCINWNDIPDGANPTAGHLPDARILKKSQQLENLALAVLSIAKKGDLIVDFCSGSGHLGILIAYLLSECTVILLENKEQSLARAKKRVHEMGLKNVYFFQCNLDFFIGKFNIGIGLHACGIASDLVLDKCLKANAKFVICPCCYGSLHATDRLVYPRSNIFNRVSIDQYLCIGHAADQTHEEHPLTIRGSRCMAIIDSDRARLAEEYGYKVTLSKLKPLSCTPKNNLLIGVPS